CAGDVHDVPRSHCLQDEQSRHSAQKQPPCHVIGPDSAVPGIEGGSGRQILPCENCRLATPLAVRPRLVSLYQNNGRGRRCCTSKSYWTWPALIATGEASAGAAAAPRVQRARRAIRDR